MTPMTPFRAGLTALILTLLLDPDARPLPKDMKLWVDCVRFVKRGAKGGALGFFTYAELSEYRLGVACYDMNIRETACGMMLTASSPAIWLVLFHIFRPDRLKW